MEKKGINNFTTFAYRRIHRRRWAVLALALFCLALPLQIYGAMIQEKTVLAASSSAEITLSAESAEQGDDVAVRISVTGNPGLAGVKLVLSFDKNRLSPAKTDQGTCRFDTGYMSQSGSLDVNEVKSGCTVVWYHSENVTLNGTLATVYFHVNESAKTGICPISIIQMDLCNASGTDVAATFTNGSVTILERQAVEHDLNGDNVVDARDMDVLYQYLTTETTAIAELDVCDINGDNAINILDYQALYEVILSQV